MERVEIRNPMVGLIAMQVCAVNDATDDEIIEKCNNDNPSGTSAGWRTVVRSEADALDISNLPVSCEDHDGRTHFLVFC